MASPEGKAFKLGKYRIRTLIKANVFTTSDKQYVIEEGKSVLRAQVFGGVYYTTIRPRKPTATYLAEDPIIHQVRRAERYDYTRLHSPLGSKEIFIEYGSARRWEDGKVAPREEGRNSDREIPIYGNPLYLAQCTRHVAGLQEANRRNRIRRNGLTLDEARAIRKQKRKERTKQ